MPAKHSQQVEHVQLNQEVDVLPEQLALQPQFKQLVLPTPQHQLVIGMVQLVSIRLAPTPQAP
jgi:hypothetical protein